MCEVVDAVPAAASIALVAASASDAAATAEAIALCRRWRAQGRVVDVEFVLQPDAEVAKIDRVPTSLAGVVEASRLFVAGGVATRWVIPLTAELIPRLDTLHSLARDTGVVPVLAIPAELATVHALPATTLDADTLLFLRDFIAYRLLEEDAAHLDGAMRTRLAALLDSLAGERLDVHANDVRVLVAGDETGSRWWAGRARRSAWGADAAALAATAAAPAATAPSRGAVLADMAGVVGEGVRALLQWLRAQAAPADPCGVAAGAPARLPRVLVIGAYGGEHIGDAAILGGVLFRMHRRFGTTHAILMSQRPHHTRHLIPMLDVPVTVRVEEYRQRDIPALLAECDGVVFAGGPLMDLPKQLVKHLYTVSVARRRGLPFVIEGIGVGPFVRRPSEWTARLIARMAGRLTVRTSDDAGTDLVRGLAVETGRDPAFDYLETRPPHLTRWPAAEQHWLAALLRAIEGRPLVALNIRPIRHDYTEGAPAATRAAFTRTVESRCEEELAAALVRFHDASAVAPCFVFFPMNAIQFGQSDLRSAYRILRHLPARVDFRIWECDASLDGVIALLREADVAVCMRFHAAIFALAQRVPVVGVDYRIGRKDKVGALLDDFGMGENCRRIDELTADWLYERLCVLAASRVEVGDRYLTPGRRGGARVSRASGRAPAASPLRWSSNSRAPRRQPRANAGRHSRRPAGRWRRPRACAGSRAAPP